MRRTVIITAVWLLAVSASASAFTLRFTPSGEPVRWPEEGSAIFYLVGTRDGADRGRKVEALDRAFHSWQKRLPGTISFVFAGSGEGLRVERDGTNLLVWVDEEWSHGPEVAALATTWYCPATGLIDEVDIEFNARDYRWATGEGEEGLDLKSVALHEIGHLLGLGHSFHPSAVMHDTISPGPGFSRRLSRDDVEAISLLYPPVRPGLFISDLPVLFFPDTFSGQTSFSSRSLDSLSSASGITALGSVSLAAGEAPTGLALARLDPEGRYLLEVASLPSTDGEAKTICPPAELVPPARIVGLAGVDYRRRGERLELAVLSREGGGERVSIYRVIPGEPLSGQPLFSSAVAPAASADNFLGMASLDASGDGFADELVILRAAGAGFSLAVYSLPREGDYFLEPLAPADRFAVSVRKGSRLLGLAALDADGRGKDELVVLERTLEGKYRLHAYRVEPATGGRGKSVSHLFSAVLPDGLGGVLPARIAGIDAHGDGFFNDLAILNRLP